MPRRGRRASLRKMTSKQKPQAPEGAASAEQDLMDTSPDYSEEATSSSQTLLAQEEQEENKAVEPSARPPTPLPHYPLPAIPDTPFTEDCDLDKAEELDVEKELRGLFINDPQVAEPRPFSCPALELIKPIAQNPLAIQTEKNIDANCSFASTSSNQKPALPSGGESSKTQENANAQANICARPPTPLPRFTEAMSYLFGQDHELTSWENFEALREIHKVFEDNQEQFAPRQFPLLKQVYIPMTMHDFLLQFKNLVEKFSLTYNLASKARARNIISLPERAFEAKPEDTTSAENGDSPVPSSSGRRNAIPSMTTLNLSLLSDYMDSDDETNEDEDSDDE